MKKLWIGIVLIFLLLSNGSLLFSQQYHIGDIIEKSDGSKGVVFYINPEKTGGWMVALNDVSPGCRWGTSGNISNLQDYSTLTITDLLQNELDGKSNTQKIRSYQNNNATYAAGLVDFPNGWYLPSIGQLRILVSRMGLIQPTLLSNNGSVMVNDYYWSSTERDASSAWSLVFQTNYNNTGNYSGGNTYYYSKTNNAAVRAICDFEMDPPEDPTYYWEPPIGEYGQTVVVTPTETTTYTVTVTDNGCSVSGEITVVVNELLNVTVTADNYELCSGGSTTLHAPVIEGATYAWTPTNQLQSPTNQPNVTTKGLTETTTFTVTVTKGNCQSQAEVTIQVGDMEASLSGPDYVCSGEQFELSAEPYMTGYSYSWRRNGDDTNWSGPSVQVTEDEPGFYEYTVMISNGACDGEASWTVEVGEMEVLLDGPDYVCVDTEFELNAEPYGSSYSYIWERDGMTMDWGGSTVYVTESTTGVYEYSVTVSDGTCDGVASWFVEVGEMEVLLDGPDYVCVDMPFELNAEPYGSGYSYIWKRNGVTMNWSGSTVSVTESQTGSYQYSVTVSDGTCSNESSMMVEVEELTANLSSPSSICVGTEFNLTAQPSGIAYTYSWKRNGIATTWTGSTIPVTENQTGSYQYSVTVSDGTCTDEATVTVNVGELTATLTGPESVCVNSSFELTASPAGNNYTYSWKRNGTPTTWTGSTVPVTENQTGSYQYSVTVSDGTCTDEATVTVNVGELTATLMGPESVCVNSQFELSATPAGNNYTYSWKRNGTPMTWTGSTVPVTESTVGTNTYSVTVSDGTCTDEATVTVNVGELTATLMSPESVCVNSQFELSATPAGNNYTYSWKRNGTPTTWTGSTVPVTENQTGSFQYSVTVSDGTCTDEATVTVNVGELTATLTGPESVCVNSQFELSATPAGNNYTYSWKRNGVATTWTGSTVPVTENQTGSYQYSVTVSDGTCTDEATVTVNVGELTATLTGPESVCVNSQFELSATPAGNNYTYSWKRNGTPMTWTGSTVPVTESTVGTNTYSVTVSDGTCTDEATVTVNVGELTATLTGPESVCVNSQFELSATPAGNNYTYSWKRNGTPMTWTGSTVPVTENQTGSYQYSVTVSDGTCTDEATVTVNVGELTATLTGPESVCVNSQFELSATPAGNNYTYSWKRNGTPMTWTGSTVPVTESTVGTNTYSVTVSDGTCTDEATVTVNVGELTATLMSPESVCVNSQFELSATPAGNNYTYSWKRNGTPTTWTGSTVPVTENQTGSFQYSVTVSDGTCTDEANWTINVTDLTATLSGPSSVCVGSQFELSATPAGNNYTYSWKRNGIATTWTGSTVPVTENQTGSYQYSVTVSDGTCTDEATVTVNVGELTATLTGPESVCVNSQFELSSTPAGNNYTYSWKRNGTPTTWTGSTIPVTENQTGSYQYSVTVSDGTCTDEATVTVNVGELTATLTGPESVCVNSQFELSATPAGNNYTYSWKRNGTPTTWTGSTVPVTENQTGSYQYSVTVSDGTCTDEANWTINVTDLTATLSGPSSVCVGFQFELSAQPAGTAYTYTWKRNGVTMNWTGSTVPVTEMEAGSVEYSVTVNDEVCSDSDSFYVTVESVLQGDTTVLTCEPFVWYGQTYPISGDYPHVFENGSYLGCDSTVMLHLTIEPVQQGDTTVVVGVPFEWYGQTHGETGDYPHTFVNGSYLGCDSTVMLHLTVLPVLPGDTTVLTCEPFEWYGETYGISGDYPHVFVNGSYLGCDSTVVLHLTVEPVLQGDTTVLTCELFVWYGQTYPTSGDYPYVFENGSYLGCDSTVMLHLTIEPVQQGDTTVVVGVPFEWYGQTYGETGDYPHTFVNGSYLGCDSTVMLHLTVLPVLPGDTTVLTCEPFEWYGETYGISGDYPHVFVNGSYLGCDSTVVLHLTVEPVLQGDTTMLTCEPFEWHGQTFGASGDYPYTFVDGSFLGCDSTVMLHLTIEPVQQGDTTVVVGVPFEWYGETYDESGDYPHTFVDGSYLGCDSTVMLHLTVLPSVPGDTTALVCEPFEWYDQLCETSGDYTHVFEGGGFLGNDSTVVLHLTVEPVLQGDTTVLTCEPFAWYGQTYPTSGDYPYVFENGSYLGCDSTVMLHLTIEPVQQGDTTVVVGVPFEWYGETYDESGDYPHTFVDGSYLGCDSTVMLHLTVLPSVPGDTTALVCEPFEWYGEIYGESGDYPHTFVGGGNMGNDSIVVLHLTVEPVLQGDTTVLTCEPFEWHGQTFGASGDYPYTFVDGSYLGCDSTVMLHLTIEPVQQGDTTVIVATPFEWYGETYDESGDYPHTFVDGSYLGCDSTVMLHLTVLSDLPGDTTALVCEPFEWYGQLCETTGDYFHTFVGGGNMGNDSIVVLHLTVEPVLQGDTTVLTCEPFDWHGQTFGASGDYPYTFVDGSYLGCDSTVMLHLTIEPVQQGDTTVIVATPFEWYGETYDESGDYPYTFVDGSYLGCDSTVMLHLTVLSDLPGDTTALVCEPFEWYGQLCETTGDYYHTFEGGGYMGNDSTVILHLIVEPVLPGDTTVVTGAPFEWHGETYSVSGDYPFTFIDGSYLGCDSTVVLHLTILPPSVGDTTALVCEPFEWYGQLCETTGDYTHVFEGGGYWGNDSTVVLHLTVELVLPGDTIASSCGPFEWYGQLYDASGDYPHTIVDGSYLGCDSIVTLHLTVYPLGFSEIWRHACDTFEMNGHTYTTSGIFYDTLKTSHECDSIVILHLTVDNSVTYTWSDESCDSYDWNTTTYYESGFYTQYFETINGCDSIVTLDLTIGHDVVTDTLSVFECDEFEWNGTVYKHSGIYQQLLQTSVGCDSLVTIDLTISNPNIHILGNTNVAYASDLWPGIYHYYLSDTTEVVPGSVTWYCTNPNWIMYPISEGHCKVMVRTQSNGSIFARMDLIIGCDVQRSLNLITSNLNINELGKIQANVFPNPAQTRVTIQAPRMTGVKVYSIQGQLIREVILNEISETFIEVGDLNKGAYLVEIFTIYGKTTETLMISK